MNSSPTLACWGRGRVSPNKSYDSTETLVLYIQHLLYGRVHCSAQRMNNEQRSYGRNNRNAQVNHGRSKSCFNQHLQNEHTLGQFKEATVCMIPLVTNWGPNLSGRRIVYIISGGRLLVTMFTWQALLLPAGAGRGVRKGSSRQTFWLSEKSGLTLTGAIAKKKNVDYHASHNRIQILRGTVRTTYDTINAETVEQNESLKLQPSWYRTLSFCLWGKMDKIYPELHKKNIPNIPEIGKHVYQVLNYTCI
jgi:hypothetical protein